MPAIQAISLSGMSAARTVLGASARNMANLSTTALRRQQVQLATSLHGGVTASSTQAAVDRGGLETDFVGLLVAKNQFLANLAVFRTNDQMVGSLLDLFG